jgi:hypothetical protein
LSPSPEEGWLKGDAMRVVKVVFILGVMGVIGVSSLYAQQRAPAGELSPADYNKIMQLYGYYTRDVDPGAVRDASWLFTPDATFEFRYEMPGGGTKYVTGAKGATELKAFYTRLLEGRSPGTRHLNSNHLIEWTPEGANGTIVMTVVEKKENKPPLISYFGVYHDRLVKTPDGWKFKARVLTRDGFYPD